MSWPYLGREAVSFSSILHDDLKELHRCGRIAGYFAFHLPQG
jgi:hypothetical protein